MFKDAIKAAVKEALAEYLATDAGQKAVGRACYDAVNAAMAAEKAKAEMARQAKFAERVKALCDGLKAECNVSPVEIIRAIAAAYEVGAVVRMPSTAGSAGGGTGSAGRPRDEAKWDAVRNEITANPLKSNNGVSLATGVCAATVARIRSSMHSAATVAPNP